MKNKTLKEITVPLALIVISVLLLNPFHFWMPDMMIAGILVALLVLFGIFASFILKEKAFDERDDMNRSLAGRNAFLAGSAIIMIAIITQGYRHSLDPWLVVALTVMIIIKIGSHFWNNKNL